MERQQFNREKMKMSKTVRDPIKIAQNLRKLFIREIPRTMEQYYQRGNHISAYQMSLLIREQMRESISFADAATICAEVNPELFAEYWLKLEKQGAG